MKILHLHTELNKTCGITKTILLLAKNPGDEFRYLVFTLGGDNAGLFSKNGISTSVLRVNKYSPSGIIKTVKTIIKICKKEKIDIIHSHHRYFDFIAFIISKIVQVKRLTTVQSKVFGYKWFSYKSPYLIAVSNAVKIHLLKNYKISESRITVINNFVEEDIQADSYSDLEKIFPYDKKVFLFIGRFSKEKGVDILVEAFKILQSKRKDVHLVMIGSGNKISPLKSFIQENKLSAEIIAPRENINAFYMKSFAVVLPSRVDPFPLVMLEAGIMAKPFIGASVDGIEEFIENGKDGFLVSPGNTNELYVAMIKLLDEPLLADSLGKHLFLKVKQKCSINAVLPHYLEYIERLCQVIKKVKIFGILLSDVNYNSLLQLTGESISQKKKVAIGYCTAHILNLAYNNYSLKTLLNSFDYLHSDGIGTFIALKILWGKESIKAKITGSDFYPILIREAIKNNWSFYFFGDSNDVLNNIHIKYPRLNIKGMHSGFNFDDKEILQDINKKDVNILIVGLGTPLQEEWVAKCKNFLSVNVIFTVGDGIKIFAGIKQRGPIVVQRFGLEWLVRLISNPAKMWKRYLIGIPQFLLRVILNKIRIIKQ